MNIRKVLVYIDALSESHPALQRALQIAEHHRLELKIVDIVDTPAGTLLDLHRPMRNLVEKIRKERLASICDSLRNREVPFTTDVIRGRPFVEIVREVVDDGFQLVIKTSSGTLPTELIGAMGPVDMRLVRNCPCPVWLEVPGRQISSRRVLVAIDPQAADQKLNQTLLQTAAELATDGGGRLSVVAAWEVPDESILAGRIDPAKLKQYAAEIESRARAGLEGALSRAGIPSEVDLHFQKGDPAVTILEVMRRRRSDLIVMGTLENTTVRGLLIGNTAETVLRQTTCSVLAIRHP